MVSLYKMSEANINSLSNLKEITNDFNKNGFTVIPNFLSNNEIDDLLSETSQLVNNFDLNQHRSVFKTGKGQGGDDYFLSSGDKIAYFFEEKAFNESGQLIVPRDQCLNKMGHALHWLNPIFKRLTFDQRIKQIVKSIGYIDPVIVQSMVIFKNPRIGGEVTAHQDSEFLYTEPTIKLMGFWIALSDVTLDNGCLWFIPGSHCEQPARRFIRNPEPGSDSPVIFTAPEVTYDPKRFVPVTVSKGSCVLIHGQVIHKSESNTSNRPRPVYTFHVIDQHEVNWPQNNWLQPTKFLPFPSLYNN